MTDFNWHDLIQRHIVRGEAPYLESRWDQEEPETYLRRPYKEAGAPATFRAELLKAMNWALESKDLNVLNRALRLTKLIPHADFASTLQDVFLFARSRDQRNSETDGPTTYREIALLAVKAMYELQPMLPPNDERRPFWEMMWISLLKDKEYGIAAYNGLRYLNLRLALQQLPLLLRGGQLKRDDVAIILRGTKRDLLRNNIGVKEALLGMIARQSEEELLSYRSLYSDIFGDQTVEEVLNQARADAEEELAKAVALATPLLEEESPDSLRHQLFPPLASWLKDKISIFATSIWLVDNEMKKVHFMGHAGLQGTEPDPPCVMPFGQYVSGTVAATREHLLRDFSTAAGPDIYNLENLRNLGPQGVFSVYVDANEEREKLSSKPIDETKEPLKTPSLTLVVNFFDSSVNKLQHLRSSCCWAASVVARTAQQALNAYTNHWVADLNAKLTETPGLEGVTKAFVEVISKALPSKEEHVLLYLYDSDLRQPVLYMVYDFREASFSVKFQPGEEASQDPFRETLYEIVARGSSALRIFDITEAGELPVRIPVNLGPFDFHPLNEKQGLSYLGVPVRESAERGFTGRLLGVVEMYRPIAKRGGRVFTPIGEHIVAELVRATAQSFVNALEQELRTYEPIFFPVQEHLESRRYSIGDVTGVCEKSENEFRAESQDLLESWYVADNAPKVFLAFRTLYDKCTAYWAKPGPRFSEDERSARRALQRAILKNEQLVIRNDPVMAVNPRLLAELAVPSQFIDTLSSLRMALLPLVHKGRPDGLIGLEFASDQECAKAIDEIRTQEKATRYVRNSTMRIWLDYRHRQVSLFATFLELFSRRAEEERWVTRWQDLFSFLAHGRADSTPIDRFLGELTALALKRRSFGELTTDALKGLSSTCILSEECANWRNFAHNGHLDEEVNGPAQLLAMPSAVRIVLATATAPMLWGGTAMVKLVDDGSGWSKLKINVQPNGNGHGPIASQTLSLAKRFSEYRGWGCDNDQDDSGMTMLIPRIAANGNYYSPSDLERLR
ncbi:MAG TPA: hypothetical protein VN643_11690 [Pyrinomonadaceae bacterium]|nr:hypothetical protein [Pyrinomonadaceae bacterium]